MLPADTLPLDALPHNTLNALLDLCDVDMRPGVDFSGHEPALPSPILLASAGAVSLAAVGTAASNLWQLRGGPEQRIDMSLKTAAAYVRSYEFLSRDGITVTDNWRGLSGFYACRDDRWIRFHCNFPHHEAAVRRVLQCDGDEDAVIKVIRTWDAEELENAILDAGGCAYMIRSRAEWQRHPQALALDTLPVMEIVKIGEAPVKPLPHGSQPLSGIRALDLTRVIAGPVIGCTLAAHGADVMRIASPDLPFIEPLVIDTGHGKLSAHIDLNTDGGRQTLRHLLKDADIFTQGYRPGAIAGRGFAAEDIARDFPGTVYVSLSAWSHKGPWAHRRGFDSLVQCATGWAVELGGAAQPKLQPAQAIDYVSGYLGAFGAMEALRRRATIGGTWMVRLSLAQTGRWSDRLGRSDFNTASSMTKTDAAAYTGMLMSSETPFGRIGHLKPVPQLPLTPPRWARSTVPLGTHEPEWPEARQTGDTA